MKRGDLTIYQVGALTYHELQKKAAEVPSFVGFLDPPIFFRSFGWFQTKNKRGYTDKECASFRKGFEAARALPK